ncbi:hypothetical protein L6R52_03005 [Myxococcota bacterium]|nr:hypothetical protein [Myxococcota bacterium]
MSRFCRDAAERLSAAIFLQRGAQVVEAERVAEIIREQERQSDIKFNEKLAVKVGKLVGATHIGIGSYSEAGEIGTISFKFMDVETGMIASVAQAGMLSADVRRLFPAQVAGAAFQIVQVVAEAMPFKKDGNLWDASGTDEAPDLGVILKIGNNKSIELPKMQNSHRSEWRLGASNDGLISYDPRDPVVIHVWDRDVLEDDIVGVLKFAHGFPDGVMESGVFEADVFGAVRSFKIRFERR